MREQRALQQKWQRLYHRAVEVDHRSGGVQRAQTGMWAALLPGGTFDAYVVQVAEAFGVSVE